jgi:hypothetical protein
MGSTYDLIREAVINKQQVIGTYNGYTREMCPHCIGYNKRGQKQALFFQFAGGSSKGLPPGGEWRCIPIDGLSNVTVRSGAWHTGANHSRPQTCVDSIDVEVIF